MSKKAVRRILATVLAFTMMWGMCLSVSAAGGATSCMGAIEDGNSYIPDCEITDILDSVADINTLPAGRYISFEDWDALISDVNDALSALEENFTDCTNEDYLNSFGAECGCQEKYNAWVAAVNALEAAIKVSDGSNYVEPVVPPCTPSIPSNSTPSDSSSASSDASNETTVEEVVKTPENDFGTFMEATTTDVTETLEQINAAIAAGDTAKAQALKAEGVTVDTGVWHSYNVSVYEQIEKAGIPVTLKFIYGGLRWKVTIPAGAKVTELCDENGWCGFLNLAAHYGFELL